MAGGVAGSGIEPVHATGQFGERRPDEGRQNDPVQSSLMRAAQAGDVESFAALTLPYRARLRTLGHLLLGSVPAADVALDDALMRAWRGLRGYRDDTTFEAWLTRVVTSTCLRLGAVRRPAPWAADIALRHAQCHAGPPAAAPPPPAAEEPADPRLTPAVLQALPVRQRAVLVLTDVLGWRVEDVAGVLGVSATTVRTSLVRGRAQLAGDIPLP